MCDYNVWIRFEAISEDRVGKGWKRETQEIGEERERRDGWVRYGSVGQARPDQDKIHGMPTIHHRKWL